MGLEDVALVQTDDAPPIAENQKVIVRLVQEGNAIGLESKVFLPEKKRSRYC